MPEPHLRAADADRAAVAATLGEHMAAGRLTVAEYEDRLARAYAARTYGELAELTTDLPGAVPAPRSGASASPSPDRGAVHGWAGDPHSWRSWASTTALVVAIWAITSLASGSFLYFWPIWVAGPWGAVLLVQSLGGWGDDGRERRRR
ncbi:DUF1707 domain-containing protein [Blastococcus sp. TML/M2B]|uniref:DUF1707 SHOCT-like domain-containing protein n=1 Tax=unclassified Blastococcus TaxID=2619396 RepID=UPI00190E4971|nr:MULTISPECIES: DUF1707 domain-containing protein [unclassified Blastococcus]MBN1094449.1 DUF1707 domain-containing protein [Blastococcus sp. TML/M2B]MBN1095408.1 DUF1707 domain-containing protein [Blastococcus sp. TML/C7B]